MDEALSRVFDVVFVPSRSLVVFPTAAEAMRESALTPKVASLASVIEKPPERCESETPKFSSESHLRPSFLEAPAERRTKRASM